MDKNLSLWGLFLLLWGLLGRIVDSAESATMIVSLAQYLNLSYALFYNGLIAFGVAALCLKIYELAIKKYSKWLEDQNKAHTVPYGKALLYLMYESVLCETLKMDTTAKGASQILKNAAVKNKISIWGRNSVTQQMCKIPKKYLSNDYHMVFKGPEEEKQTVVITKKGDETDTPLYVGLTINEGDMLRVWPPHSRDFVRPISWIGEA
jgi:hypothetical protein